MYYAMGYCGAGVGTASYFGMRIGQQLLGRQEGRTALDGSGVPDRSAILRQSVVSGPLDCLLPLARQPGGMSRQPARSRWI